MFVNFVLFAKTLFILNTSSAYIIDYEPHL